MKFERSRIYHLFRMFDFLIGQFVRRRFLYWKSCKKRFENVKILFKKLMDYNYMSYYNYFVS